jgi:hypothetical protein
MKKPAKYIALVLILLFASLTVFANKAAPPPLPKATNGYMQIRVDEKATETRLLIPRGMWQKMRAEFDGEENSNAANRFKLSSTQTVMSGIFLSLAFVFGGVWFARGGRGPKKSSIVIGAALIALLAGVTTVSFANMPPPPRFNKINSEILSEEVKGYGRASGAIKIEVVDDSLDTIILVLPKSESK